MMGKRRRGTRPKFRSPLGDVVYLEMPVVRLHDNVTMMEAWKLGTLAIAGHCDLELSFGMHGGFYVVVRPPGRDVVLGRYVLKNSSFIVALVRHLFGVELPETLEVTDG